MTVIETKHMRAVSERRGIYELPGDDGELGYIGVWVDGVQIAAGVRHDEGYAERHNGARWALWSGGLDVTPLKAPRGPFDTHSLAVRAEADVRVWLDLLGDLAEHGPRSVKTRKRARA
jgi:hypothetical protein